MSLLSSIPGEDDLYVQLKLFNFSLTLIVGVLGLIGNAVIIYVNQRIKTTSSTDIYISWLAISDNGLIISLSLYAYRCLCSYLPWLDCLAFKCACDIYVH